MKRMDNIGTITTLTACILVVMLVGISMFAFNEYERASLRQQAMTQTTSDIIVGDYKYSFSNLTKIESVGSSIADGIDMFGDKIIWVQYLNNQYILRGYNLTTNSHFIVKSSGSQYLAYYNADIGDGVVTWVEDIDATSGKNYRFKAYLFSNGTTWTASPLTPTTEYGSSVVVGKYVVYCSRTNTTTGATKVDVMRFNTKNWTVQKIYSIPVSSASVDVYLEQGGIEDEIIFSTSAVGYYRLNVETLATTPLTSLYNIATHQHVMGISDNSVGIIDYTSSKFKAINFKTGKTTTLDNVSSTNTYEYHQYINLWGDNFFSYFTLDPVSPTTLPLIRFYDTDTDTRFAIPYTGTPTSMFTGNGFGMSDKYVAMLFGGEGSGIQMFYYSYSRTSYTATANNTHDGNDSNETAVPPETNLEKAQSWLQDNWIYFAVIGLVVGIAVYVGYKKFASSPKYREVGAKKNVNWGLIVAIGVITVLAIIFMV